MEEKEQAGDEFQMRLEKRGKKEYGNVKNKGHSGDLYKFNNYEFCSEHRGGKGGNVMKIS